MKENEYPDELTRARWDMDDAENETERAWLREGWLRLKEREYNKLPLRVRQLKERGPYTLEELVNAYGGFDAFLEYTSGRAA